VNSATRIKRFVFDNIAPATGRYTLGSTIEGYAASSVTVVVEADR